MYRILYTRILFPLLLAAVISAMFYSCANRGIGPQGGPKDDKPPVVVKETPANGSVNFTGKRIEVAFNEYIQLDKVADNVLISPPQQRPPEVKAVGKHLTVTFDEDLRDSTTYTIDFGSAICDNNEKNPMKGYSFSFATGDVIDSLEISGQLLNAEDLNPVSGVIVGIHKNPDDSALSTMPFTRISKTDAEGYFTIHNIHPGSYRIYALGDVSKDYLYQPGESLALYDSLITPVCHSETSLDTLWKDSLTVDTVVQKTETIYQPDDILLMYFKENKQRRYFQRALREEQHYFTLYFAAPQDSMPQLRLLRKEDVKTASSNITDEKPTRTKKSKKKKKKAADEAITLTTDTVAKADTLVLADTIAIHDTIAKPDMVAKVDSGPRIYASDIAFIQVNPTKDTITCWLIDSSYISQDTLIFEMRYQKTDSVYELQWQTDTVNMIYRAPRISEKAKARLEKNKKIPHVELRSNGKSPFEIYSPLTVNTSTPVRQMIADSIHFFEMVDTVAKALPFTLLPVDSSYMRWQIEHKWKPETEYKLNIDSAAMIDIYGNVNEAQKYSFKTRTLDEYSSIIVKIDPFDTRAMVQILDDKDSPVRTMRASEEGTKFEYLSPKSYYMRVYLDLNGDSVWTTGDYQTHRHPEPVYYFPSKLTLRANWDFEETIRYLENPVDEQKPKEITKDAAKKK